MKAREAKLGARVTSNNNYYKGIISSNSVSGSDDETVIVEWTNGNGLEKCNVNELRFAPEVLEEEYQAVQTKLNTAKLALAEANALINKRRDHSSLRDWDTEGIVTLHELFNELDNAGWNTSSMTRDC